MPINLEYPLGKFLALILWRKALYRMFKIKFLGDKK